MRWRAKPLICFCLVQCLKEPKIVLSKQRILATYLDELIIYNAHTNIQRQYIEKFQLRSPVYLDLIKLQIIIADQQLY